MTDNFSLNDLFAKGMTREQFIAKYGEMSSGSVKENSAKPSIFNGDISGSIGEIFDTLNKEGDTLEEEELQAFMGQDGNVDDISEADLQALYRQMAARISSSKTFGDPQMMYSASNAASNPESNTYIQDLSSQMEMLNNLISMRESNSYQLTSDWQSKIDELIANSNTLSADFKKKYASVSKKLADAKKEAAQNNVKIQANAVDLQDAKTETAVLQQQIQTLDPEKDADTIKSYQKDLKEANSRLNKLSNEQQSLMGKRTSYASKIEDLTKELGYLTSEAQIGDSEIKTKVQDYKVKIDSEKKSCDSEVKTYKGQIAVLERAQQYAISQLPKPGISDASAVDDGSFHKNDNAMSFDELSKSGLKYSTAKGQKLAQTVRSKVCGFTGYCSRHVSNALRDSGLGNERAPSAHMMDDKLRNNKNFKEVKISSVEELRSLPAGCVIVYEAGAARYNAKHGHIEISLGDGTAASDGITRNMRYTENMSVFVPVDNA
ncbi:MAG: hypothetical protein NC200_04785 [Candidatus Gastranaerophilales bacterium]|nr:hypothetical protein [Candidatus Gastranaerophilales bacterium]